MCLEHRVCLEVAYAHWWDPRQAWPWLPPHVALFRPRARPPSCNTWYKQPAAVPKTARWALVQDQWPPGEVIYYKTRDAAVWRFEELPYADHPHVRLVPVERL